MKFLISVALCLMISPVWAGTGLISVASREGNVAVVFPPAPDDAITPYHPEIWSLQPWKRRCIVRGVVKEFSNKGVFSADGRLVAFGLNNSTTKIYETQSGKLWARLGRPQKEPYYERDSPDTHYYATTSLAFSPDRKTLASANNKGLFYWDLRTKKLLFSRPLRYGARLGLSHNLNGSVQIGLLKFAPNGKTLAVAGGRTLPVFLYDIARKRVRFVLQLRAEDGQALAMDFSPGSNRLMVASYYNVSATAYNKLFLFDTRDGRTLWQWNNRSNHPYAYDTAAFYKSAVFASDGRRFALGNERFLEIRSARNGHLLLQRLHKGDDYPTLEQQRQLLPALAVR